MKDLRATRGKALLDRWIAQGEHEHQDFKFTISDARKIARSISAFANNDGGRLLIGVKDNGVVAGVRNEEDIYVVEQAAARYCRPEGIIEFASYRYSGSTAVIVATVQKSDAPPVSVVETDGTLRAYYRVADRNIAAPELMIRAWQRRNSSPEALSFGDSHRRLMALMEERGSITSPREAALALHISQDECRRCIVDLAAARIVIFSHDGTRFRLLINAK